MNVEQGWRTKFLDALPVLGHRNWVIVADSAYPDQIAPGVRTIVADGDPIRILDFVIQAVGKAPHVRPTVLLDSELEALDDQLAPGSEAIRLELRRAVAGQGATSLPHEEILQQVDSAGQLFRILVIKTSLTIPYTSVFLRLECGYWGEENEARLREAMRHAE